MKLLHHLFLCIFLLLVWGTSFQIFPVEARLGFHRNRHAKLRSIFSDSQFVYNFFKHLLQEDGRSLSTEVTPSVVIENKGPKSWNTPIANNIETGRGATSDDSTMSTALATSGPTTPRSYYCSSPSIPSDGVIIPEGDQTWAIGSVHNVSCLVNPDSGITSQDIYISLGFNQPPLPHQVVDDYTITVTLNATEAGIYKLLCISNASPEPLCMRSVKVGYPPLDVKNLKCVSWNWNILECNWTIPDNPAQAPSEDYLVHLVTDIAENPCEDHPVGCTENCCKWRVPEYRQTDQNYTISFYVSNKLGSATFDHIFINTETVVPNPAENINPITTNGSLNVKMEWELPVYMETLAMIIGIQCAVEYRPSPHLHVNDTWLLGNFSICYQKKCNTEITVEHPGVLYEFRVRLRAKTENFTLADDGWWSNWTAVGEVIPSQRPWTPPILDVGTFQSKTGSEVGRRDLTVAWRPLPLLEHNGPDFSYVVNATADGLMLNHTSITNTYTTFSDISNDAQVSLEVTASNSMGACKYTSHLEIYPTRLMPPLPVLPVVIRHESTQQYELIWDNKDSSLHSFTVYVCTDGLYSKEPCQDNLYWIEVGNSTSVNVTLTDFNLSGVTDNEIRFALSAETATEGISSGMSWDNCFTPQNYTSSSSPPEIGKSISSNATSVNITWTLECKDRGAVVEAIMAEVCQGSYNFTQPCEYPEVITETDVISGQVQLTHLKPGTEYSARLRLLYRKGLSNWSKYEVFTTDNVPNPGMAAWLIIVISLGCIITAVFLVLCFTYSKGQIKEVLQDLNRELNIPIPDIVEGKHDEKGTKAQGNGTVSSIPNIHSYENFYSKENISEGLNSKDYDTIQSDSSTSSTNPSPQLVKGGRSIATGDSFPGSSEEKENLLLRDSETKSVTACISESFNTPLQSPSNMAYVQANFPFEIIIEKISKSESTPSSALPPKRYVAPGIPDLPLMSTSTYVSLNNIETPLYAYSKVNELIKEEANELSVYKPQPINSENGECNGYVSSDYIPNSSSGEIIKANVTSLPNLGSGGYVQVDHAHQLSHSPQYQAGPFSNAYVSIGGFPLVGERKTVDGISDKITENNKESEINDIQNVFARQTNGYVEHPFTGKEYDIECAQLTKNMLHKESANAAVSDKFPEFAQHLVTRNEYDEDCAKFMKGILPNEHKSNDESSGGKLGIKESKTSEMLKQEMSPKICKVDTALSVQHKPSLGYVAAGHYRVPEHILGVTANIDQNTLYGLDSAPENSQAGVSASKVNLIPQKISNSGYVMDQNVKNIFENKIGSTLQPQASLAPPNFTYSKDKNEYSVLQSVETKDFSAGSPDSGISNSEENLYRLIAFEKARSEAEGKDWDLDTYGGSELEDFKRSSVTSHDIPPGYCRVRSLHL